MALIIIFILIHVVVYIIMQMTVVVDLTINGLNMLKRKYLSSCIFAVLITSGGSYASNDNCDQSKDSCDQHSLLETVVVVGNRVETENSKYAGSIGVIDEDKITESSNLMDSLSSIPGVEAGGDNGRNIGQQYTIRGFGYSTEQRVIIQQDGVPQSPSLFSNHISSFRTDPDLLERVEVVKGASSILYGSGAIGGVIDMKTKDAQSYLQPDEHFGGLIGSRYESNNMHSIRGGLYGKADALPIDYLIYAKRASFGDITLADGGTDDYQKVDNDETVDTVYFNLGWNISDEQRVSFSVFDFEEELTTVVQTLYHHESATPIYGKLKQTDYVADYSYESVANSLLNLNMKLYVSNASYGRESLSITRGTHVDYENKDSRWGIAVKNLAEFETGSISHMLLTGLDYKNRKEDANHLVNGVKSDFGSMPNQYNDWGLYVQDIMSIQRLEVTLGGRFDIFDRSLDRANSTDYKDQRFSPRIATAYELVDGLQLLFGYAESFRAPTPHEISAKGALNPYYYYLENPDLKAETAKEFEGGFSYLSDSLFTEDDALYIKATVFDGKIENMITLEKLPELGTPPESTMYAQYQNIKNARRKGYEVSAKYLIDEFLLQSSYEHLDIYDEETKQNATQGFADKLNVTTTYTNENLGLELKIGLDHWFKPKQNPKSFVSRGKTYTKVDQEFTQVNFAGKWRMANAGLDIDYLDDVTVKFGVKNIFDEKYINAQFTNGTSRVGPGTNYYADVEFDF